LSGSLVVVSAAILVDPYAITEPKRRDQRNVLYEQKQDM
jgi:hypothetical protein